ncbi:MAG: helix-turn-helix domain-containing protein [Paraclostridium sp.]|uniref:helix-turn-helix domain-containing protein n=1 Tax=Paraclostridium sp. TaxID=2023273 RepID=UPI003EE4D0D3
MNEIFGKRFKQLRHELELNQQDLVTDFNNKYNYNFTRVAVSQYENGKRIPEIDALTSFAEYFGVSVDYLLGRTDERNIKKEKLKLDPSIKTIAAHRLGDVEDLDDEAIEKINEYIEMIRLMQNQKK